MIENEIQLSADSAQKKRIEFARNWLSAQQSISLFINAAVTNNADAEDILQEVACQVAEKYDDYDSERPFLPWSIGVAKIKIAEYYRTQKKINSTFSSDYLESLTEACFRMHSQLHPYSKALQECLKKLDSKSEKLLMLRYQENLAPQTIAEMNDTTSGSIRVKLTRIRTRLKNCMQLRVEQNGR